MVKITRKVVTGRTTRRAARQDAELSPSPGPSGQATAHQSESINKEIKRLKFLLRISEQNITQIGDSVNSMNFQQVNNHLLNRKIAEINKSFAEYKENLASLTSYSDGDDEKQFSEFLEIDRVVSEIKNTLESALVVENLSNATGSSKPTIIEAKLPRIDVPEFNGNIDEWTAFFQMFSTLVHDRANFTPIIKFQHLLRATKGPAYDIIKDFPLTAENYEEALNVLKKRYDNPRLIIDRLLGTLFDLPAISTESADSLRTLLDKSVSVVKSLENLDHPLDKLSNVIIVRTLKLKLDARSKELYESQAESHTFDELRKFLEERIPVLESIGKVKSKTTSEKPKIVSSRVNVDSKKKAFVATSSTKSLSCPLCQDSHYLNQCEKFKNLNPHDRLAKAKELRLCVNCLESGHFVKECKRSLCRNCNQRHNTLLHFDSAKSTSSNTTTTVSTEKKEPIVANVVSSNEHKILPTASVVIQNAEGEEIAVRVLLDNCSTDNFVTASCAQKLGLQTKPISSPITGIGCSEMQSSAVTRCQIRSKFTSFRASVDCNVVDKITTSLPATHINVELESWITKQHLPISDPTFAKPNPIDILLGVEVFFEILETQSPAVSVPKSRLKLVSTKLGWIVAGSWGQKARSPIVCNLSIQMERFWETEEFPSEKPISEEHKEIERHFQETHSRLANGRFVVRLPFRENVSQLKSCRELALRKFNSLERRGVSSEYSKFMVEYLSLSHMKRANSAPDQEKSYYIPHFSVFSSNKFRVVFHASTKEANGLSLNEVLMTGPTLQADLFSILLRFRRFRFAFATDIVKMYRQVALHPDDYDYQRIFWREHPDEKLEEYQLTTVTYGTSPASFLATRCLFQLAAEHEAEFPLACRAIRDQSYVDDVLSGATRLEEALKTKEQLIVLLQRGCFELSKWRSNDPRLLDPSNLEQTSPSLITAIGDSKKSQSPTLGLNWNSSLDEFSFAKLDLPIPKMDKITKRTILSQTSKLYDPLGLISPIILRGKLIFQQLWLTPCGWDDIVPKEEAAAFRKFRMDLEQIANIKIPRYVNIHDAETIELHVFGDASNHAYAAVAYLRVVRDSEIICTLLCSKTRVAPIKPVTLARLELCASVLVSKIVDKLSREFNISKSHCFAYSDSQIVLAWLSKHPSHWTCFVANRTAQIHSLTSGENWRYIPSQQNPADVASRGCTVDTLEKHALWWQGPPLLQQNDSPSFRLPNELPEEVDIEKRKAVSLVVSSLIKFEYMSSYMKILRVQAYVFRFAANLKVSKENRSIGSLQPIELEKALNHIAKSIQIDEFSFEYPYLEKKIALPKKNRLASLTPFLDKNGVIRVGGRLQNAELDFDCRHPIVLPAKHRFAQLMIEHYHRINLHAGAQSVHNAIRQKIWLFGNGKAAIRKIVRSCITCTRFTAKNIAPLMGSLPAERVTTAHPFQNTGIDYAGPITIKARGGRCRVTMKAYIAIFVCLATKAAHIEVVESLSTEDFIASFRRFIGRRGIPQKILSDNGTQFVGANNELQRFLAENENTLKDFALSQFIEWSFIPPHAPHMGGLWESAVKSAKHHMKRVIGDQILTFSELVTLLVQIEACLNSRPLAPLSSDPNDLSPLTPGHFLIGRPISALPSRTSGSIDNRKRWHLLQKTLDDFWKRWKKEYLHGLSQRTKWQQCTKNLSINDVVIIKDDQLAPTQWALGRVINIFPGRDKQVRVVELKTAKGTLKRPVVKVIPLNVSS